MKQFRDVDYAVVDVETTGFAAKRSDRIIEIAVIRLSPEGLIADKYVTLVNPGRDLGPTDVHGITGRDVLDAPRFSDIAGDIVDRLSNAVVVAHNVRFDTGFVRAECERADVDLPEFPTLCTLSLASRLVSSLNSRQLCECCKQFGIALQDRHSAEDDAIACAQLLVKFLAIAMERGMHSLTDLGCKGSFSTQWPTVNRSGKSFCRIDAERLRAADPHYLSRLVTRLIATNLDAEVPENITAYLALLDKVLEDRIVTEQESDALFSVAAEWGLSGEQVCAAHQSYLKSLAKAAWSDGIVTDTEKRDLTDVTRLLGFDKQTLDTVLNEAKYEPMRNSAESERQDELVGKSVCFTGTLLCKLNGEPISRHAAQKFARDAGMSVADNVTKSLDVLVVADPHSLSGKATKARQYGTRIIAETAFWRAIGVSID